MSGGTQRRAFVSTPERRYDNLIDKMYSIIFRVISVSNEKMRLHHIDNQNNNVDGPSFSTEQNTGNLHKQWISERSTIIEQ